MIRQQRILHASLELLSVPLSLVRADADDTWIGSVGIDGGLVPPGHLPADAYALAMTIGVEAIETGIRLVQSGLVSPARHGAAALG